MSAKDLQKKDKAAPVEQHAECPTYSPPVNILETKDAYLLTADMPGIEADKVHVALEQGVLTIRASRGFELPPGDRVYVELEPGAYERSFAVSDQLDRDKISAQCANGVLTLILPKAETAKPRTIEVKAA